MIINFSKNEYSFLASLGLSFDVDATFSIPPEKGLIQLLNREEFIGNMLYGMLKLFLSHHHDYLRVDVLVKMEKLLTPIGRSTLSALAMFCVKDLKDHRFKKMRKYSLKMPIYLNSKEYVEAVGAEPYLFERGIIVRIINIQDDKKIRPESWLLRNNPWFKNRLIFGPGVRADAFSALQYNPIKTYYELSKVLGSSLFSARKNFQDFYKIKEIDERIISLIK